MRRIDPTRFHVATRGTSRQINRQIALTLISSHQPISRADLARRMKMRRGAVEPAGAGTPRRAPHRRGDHGEAARGRKPTLLYINTRQRSSVAVDVRASRTFLMLADPMGRAALRPSSRCRPRAIRGGSSRRSRSASCQLLEADPADAGKCEGIGVVVPGMVDSGTSRVLHAPTLGWRNVDLRGRLAAATGLPVHVENAGRACALAQVWEARRAAVAGAQPGLRQRVGRRRRRHRRQRRGAARPAQHRRRVRAHADEHRRSALLLRCDRLLGSAHLERRDADALLRPRAAGARPVHDPTFTMDDLVVRARGGDRKALGALQATGPLSGPRPRRRRQHHRSRLCVHRRRDRRRRGI